MHYSVVRSLQPCPQLTDCLALERTRLANERTLRAYLRSGLTLIIADSTLINFFRENLCVWVGVVLVPVGVAVTVGGWFRFRSRQRRIRAPVPRPLVA